MKNVAGYLALLALAIGLSACTEDLTEIVVVVDSDMSAPSELDRVVIRVEGMGDQAPVETNLRTQPFPLSLGLVHDGGPLGPIRVTAVGLLGSTEVVEAERSEINFQRGKTRMLRLTLRRVCLTTPNLCKGSCADASCLTEWNPDLGKVDASTPNDAGRDAQPDADQEDAGDDEDSGVDAGSDAQVNDAGFDAGEPCVIEGGECFAYTPSNFDPVMVRDTAERNGELVIDCATAELDTTTGNLTGWCRGMPTLIEIEQSNGTGAIVIAVTSLNIAGAGKLRLVGERPVIFAVFGDAIISGTIDASAVGTVPGAGGDLWCIGGTGTAGATAQSGDGYGGGGGGGGAFGTVGGAGGRGDRTTPANAAAGAIEANAMLVPIRGGCAGGRGGLGTATDGGNLAGAGGGAVQISSAATLTVGGVIAAGGGGGRGGKREEDGGGGGGSGGAILLEARSMNIGVTAWLTANGGGGGGGADVDSATTTDGADAAVASALGGAGGAADSRGGNGGRGAGRDTIAVAGENGEAGAIIPFPAPYGAGGGGGGGGMGRIVLRNQLTGETPAAPCTSIGNFSPAATITCGR